MTSVEEGLLQLRVSPQIGNPDTEIRLVASGLKPGEAVELVARLTDTAGLTWRSTARYIANDEGLVDTGAAPAIAGDYLGVDPTGLFWSLSPGTCHSAAEIIAFLRKAAHPAHAAGRPAWHPQETAIGFALETPSGIVKAETTYRRRTVPEGVSVIEIAEEGVYGVLALPAEAGPHPGLILITGSGGGCSPEAAAAHAAHGFATLGLAYFNYPNCPAEMGQIPLEYFRNAMNWFARRLGHGRIGLRGASKGAEAALLVASTWPELVRAVVSVAPPNCAVAGVHTKGGPIDMWTLNGEAIPNVVLAQPDGPDGPLRAGPSTYGLSVRPFYLAAMRGPAAAASRIPVERIGCPLMLIVGSDDQAWSAAYACDDIAKTLRANGWPHELAYLEYNGAGHVFPPTNTVMTMSRWSFHSHLKALHVMGGTPEVNAHASRHAWRSALEFFRKHLAANEA